MKGEVLENTVLQLKRGGLSTGLPFIRVIISVCGNCTHHRNMTPE